jgi:hypothetical protein
MSEIFRPFKIELQKIEHGKRNIIARSAPPPIFPPTGHP